MNESLLARVAAALVRRHVPHALVGAAALAVHGVARSTFDLDLLTTDPSILDPAAWAELSADPRLAVSVRRGDSEDPLAGMVRIEAPGERPVDVIVGRWAWQSAALEAARPVSIAGADLPVVTPADLILLKLYAGGTQDLWDIQQLLAASDEPALRAEVEGRLGRLPPPAREAWARVARRTAG